MPETFIKIIEIWTPCNDQQSLTLSDGYFGNNHDFMLESKRQKFAFDQGLPGKAWSTANPQIIADLSHSYFQRKSSAASIGLTSGMALPIFSGEFLLAVVVFLCGGNETDAGAMELWSTKTKVSSTILLEDGYYGCLENLERYSRNLSLSRGQGLPGMIWDYQLPMLVSEPAKSSFFIRSSNAAIDNITTAIGFPFLNKLNDFVICFLSSNETPIARRFEIWLPDTEHNYLFMHAGKCEYEDDLPQAYMRKKVRRGDGLKGRAWLTGCPAISTDLIADEMVRFSSSFDYESGFVMPIIENGMLSSLIVFIF